MTKKELIEAVVNETGIESNKVEKTINSLLDNIAKELGLGNRVQLIGFGTFETRKRKARKGKNPRTGEEIDIPEAITPAFKAGKALKERVNPE